MTDSTPDQNKRHAEKMAKVQTARAKMMAEKDRDQGVDHRPHRDRQG